MSKAITRLSHSTGSHRQRGSAFDRGCDMDGFHQLIFIGSGLKTIFHVSSGKIRALNGMRHRQSDETFFTGGKGSFLKNSAIIVKKLSRQVGLPVRNGDRKSTRLNSSHVANSYAVFCLKKK